MDRLNNIRTEFIWCGQSGFRFLKKIIIIGANNFQLPLILKAKETGLETHVFAWEDGAIGKGFADFFYPVSIVDKEKILAEAKKISPDAVLSIGSDLAMITVNYLAAELGLTGNSMECTALTTNKFRMRQQLKTDDLPCPLFTHSKDTDEIKAMGLKFPLIVKPVDRSGSRGVTRVNNTDELRNAMQRASQESFSGEVISEEFIEGNEYSVEMISWKGEHFYLQTTEKETTGPPFFVEKSQHQPASLSPEILEKVKKIIDKSLTSLGVKYGASHSEVIITREGQIYITEIGARMGGDYIGSDLVQLSTGFDFVKAVIEVSLGTFDPESIELSGNHFSGAYFMFPTPGKINGIIDKSNEYPEIVRREILCKAGENLAFINESSKRPASFIYQSVGARFIPKENIIDIITS